MEGKDSDLKWLDDINVTYDLMGTSSGSPSGNQNKRTRARVHFDPSAPATQSLIQGLTTGRPFNVGKGEEVVEFIPIGSQSQNQRQREGQKQT